MAWGGWKGPGEVNTGSCSFSMQLPLVISPPPPYLPLGLGLFCRCHMLARVSRALPMRQMPRCSDEQKGNCVASGSLRLPVTSGHCPASAPPLSRLEVLSCYLKEARTRSLHPIHPLELTLHLILPLLPPTLQGVYYHSSNFIHEVSEQLHFHVTKRRCVVHGERDTENINDSIHNVC